MNYENWRHFFSAAFLTTFGLFAVLMIYLSVEPKNSDVSVSSQITTSIETALYLDNNFETPITTISNYNQNLSVDLPTKFTPFQGVDIYAESVLLEFSQQNGVFVVSGQIYVVTQKPYRINFADKNVMVLENSHVLVNSDTQTIYVLEGSVLSQDHIIAEKNQKFAWLVDSFYLSRFDASELDNPSFTEILYMIKMTGTNRI